MFEARSDHVSFLFIFYIEVGRHNGIKREDRTCSFYNDGSYDDEVNLYLACHQFDDLRNLLFKILDFRTFFG